MAWVHNLKPKRNGISDNIIKSLLNFSWNRKCRRVPHGSTFGQLLFLVYIYIYIYMNNLVGDLLNAKQFETDTSSFSVTCNVNTEVDEVNNDL